MTFYNKSITFCDFFLTTLWLFIAKIYSLVTFFITISWTTITIQRCFLWFINKRKHLRDRLHPRPKDVQPIQHGRPRRSSQLLSVNWCALTGRCIRECQQSVPPTLRYALDPVHNYSSPVLSWQAALLFTDIKKDLCIKEGIRGVLAMISHQYARANAPGMENYNASKCDNYIMYFDAINLYGWAMSQPLSTLNFK